MTKRALVVGSTGIVGGNLARYLVEQGWEVFGLARRPGTDAGVTPVAADLLDAEGAREALKDVEPHAIYVCTWLRQPTEEENVRVNGAMVRNLFAAVPGSAPVEHIALVTGTKQYLGPFEAYGQTAAETPFREETPRLPGLNFYYTQEDLLFAEAARRGAGWSVHRPHSIVGLALGNAMNMGVTLAVYASLCRERGEPFVFPGSHEQWNALTDVTDARLLARHLLWATETPAARDGAFNVVNGDVFRWRWMWAELARYWGLEPEGPPEGTTAPLEKRMGAAGAAWRALAARHSLAEPEIDRLVSWWHTDGDLGRTLECVNSMSKSRALGFLDFQDSRASFFDLFDELKRLRVVPA
jgi:nucleoside-diphosphate-sugar epimerase